MGDRLAGKVAVITGGASGIGKATVERFLDEGASVVFADLNDQTGKNFLGELNEAGLGDRARFIRTNVSVKADVEAAVKYAVDEFGRLDIMFNNAGVGGAFGKVTDLELEDWDFTFSVLMRGVFLGTKHAARVMIEQGEGGSIVNTASVAGVGGGCGPQAYSAAKAGVINFVKATCAELAADRIRLNAICPGGILTPLLHRGMGDAMAPMLAKMQPWPEAGRPEHIASAALFLASDDAVFVTGHALVVDGGLTPAGPGVSGGMSEGGSSGMSMDMSAMTKMLGEGVTGVDHGSTGVQMVFRRPEEE